MEAKLTVVRGRASKDAVAINLPIVIGRSREASFTIAHPIVSRRHCELFEQDGLIMVRDLGSLNGTLFEDKRIAEAPLPPDSEFSIGPLTFRVEYEYEGNLDALPPVQLAPEPDDESPPAAAEAAAPVEKAIAEEVVFEPDLPEVADEAEEPPAKPVADKAKAAHGDAAIASEDDTDFVVTHEASSLHDTADIDLADDVPAAVAAEPQVSEPQAEAAADAEMGEAEPPQPTAAKKKEKRGWWPFGKGKADKAAKRVEKKPSGAAAAKASAPKPPEDKDSNADDVALEALEEDASTPAASKEAAGEDLDNFFDNLK